MLALGDRLLDDCFAYFDADGSQVDDSDDAREDIARRLAAASFAAALAHADALAPSDFEARVASLASFPR